jgi:pimeloyl-ACP methyl ester carboxylesterase
MFMALVVAGIGASFAFAVQAPKVDLKKIEALATRFFEARPASHFEDWDAAARDTLLREARELGATGAFDLDAVIDILQKTARKRIAPFSGQEFQTPFGRATWIEKLPKSKPKSKGLIVGLHGGGEGAGDAKDATGYAIPDCVGIYPQGIRLVHDTWNTVHGERFVLTLIERAKLHHDVDPDRVYVAGFSMGGTGSWFFAGRHPDLFAAAAPGPGVFMANPKSQVRNKEDVLAIQHGFLPNVRTLPVSFFIGLEDKNTMPGTYLFAWDRILELREKDKGGYTAIDFRTFEGMAHQNPEGEPQRTLDWLAKQRRDPWPQKVVLEYASAPFPQAEPQDPQKRFVKRQHYWLRCMSPLDRMHITAERNGNAIELALDGPMPKEVEILLRSELAKPGEPVAVRVANGPSFKETPDQDLGLVFDTFDAYLDRRLTFDRAIRIRF